MSDPELAHVGLPLGKSEGLDTERAETAIFGFWAASITPDNVDATNRLETRTNRKERPITQAVISVHFLSTIGASNTK